VSGTVQRRPAGNTKTITAAVLTAVSLLLLSCGGEAPQLLQTSWELTASKDRDTGAVAMSLGVFVQVDDADGLEDISDLYLVSDKEELVFHVDSEGWTEREKSGETWIGTTGFVMPDRGPFPIGTYRILVLDKAGERSEGEIFIPRTSLEGLSFPSLTIDSGDVTLGGKYSGGSILLFDSHGEYLRAEPIDKKKKALKVTESDGDDLNLYVYVYDDAAGLGLVYGPYSYERQ